MIERDTRGAVTILRLAHGKASALDLELLRALDDAFAREERGDARAVVVTGTGSIFSAGADLHRVLAGGRAYVEEFIPALVAGLRRLLAFEKPLVAAINGHAIAGGCLLACACDRRLLAKGNALMGITELQVGIPFPAVALELARLAVPRRFLHEVVYLAKTYRGEECIERGFADAIVEPAELLDRAVAEADALAAVPARAFALNKRMLRAPALDFLERNEHRFALETIDAWASPECLAAMRAFVEKTIRK